MMYDSVTWTYELDETSRNGIEFVNSQADFMCKIIGSVGKTYNRLVSINMLKVPFLEPSDSCDLFLKQTAERVPSICIVQQTTNELWLLPVRGKNIRSLYDVAFKSVP